MSLCCHLLLFRRAVSHPRPSAAPRQFYAQTFGVHVHDHTPANPQKRSYQHQGKVPKVQQQIWTFSISERAWRGQASTDAVLCWSAALTLVPIRGSKTTILAQHGGLRQQR